MQEDLLHFDQEEYLRRRDARGKKLINSGMSFIYDASVDREWSRLNDWLVGAGYQTFVISLDLSKAFLEKLYQAKGYTEGNRLDLLLQQHNDFLERYGNVVNLHITDKEFAQRLEVARQAVQIWLKSPKEAQS